jgi:hypothetical protein
VFVLSTEMEESPVRSYTKIYGLVIR